MRSPRQECPSRARAIRGDLTEGSDRRLYRGQSVVSREVHRRPSRPTAVGHEYGREQTGAARVRELVVLVILLAAVSGLLIGQESFGGDALGSHSALGHPAAPVTASPS